MAADLGLGTCMLGWFNEKEVRKLLGLGRSKRIHIVFALGYPVDGIVAGDKIRKALSEMSRYLE